MFGIKYNYSRGNTGIFFNVYSGFPPRTGKLEKWKSIFRPGKSQGTFKHTGRKSQGVLHKILETLGDLLKILEK